MKTFIAEVFEVTESYDRDSRHIAYYFSEVEAQKHKKTSNYLSVYPKKLNIVVLDSHAEYADQVTLQKKLTALAKLSLEEKALLGIKDLP